MSRVFKAVTKVDEADDQNRSWRWWDPGDATDPRWRCCSSLSEVEVNTQTCIKRNLKKAHIHQKNRLLMMREKRWWWCRKNASENKSINCNYFKMSKFNIQHEDNTKNEMVMMLLHKKLRINLLNCCWDFRSFRSWWWVYFWEDKEDSDENDDACQRKKLDNFFAKKIGIQVVVSGGEKKEDNSCPDGMRSGSGSWTADLF